MKTRKRIIVLTLCAAILVVLASVGGALAYFSDYDHAIGQATLHMNGETRIDEGSSDSEKNIVIENTGDAAVVVRVAVYGPDQMQIPDSVTGWEKQGDFYYYQDILQPGEKTADAINASIELTDREKAEFGDSFSISVVHESALVVFDDNGQVQKPSGWDYIPTIIRKGGN